MSIEAAIFIADLQALNPPSTDPRSQGDDHLRLIKQVLQNSFPTLSSPSYTPAVAFFSTSGTIAKTLGDGINLITTASGPITLTLPTLVAADGFWQTKIMKYTADANPIFIIPSGTANIYVGGLALTRIRRCIPSATIHIFWDGTNFHASRATGLPIASLIDFYGTNLPAGYEWPNGQTLPSVATNYPELNARYGAGPLPDLRGFAGITLDNLGGAAAGRLPSGFIAQTTLGAIGGSDGIALTTGQMPVHFHTASISDPGHTHGVTGGTIAGNTSIGYAAGATAGPANVLSISISAATTGVRVNSANGLDTTNSSGGGAIHSNLQPSVMLAKIMVVE
jgi:microcystin-dependent protein